jgi:hypothetical protein
VAGDDVSHDAVVVVPGIMGSELVDAGSGRTLWGLRELGWYVSAWTTGAGLADLRLTDDERAGRTGRVRATGLLRFPAYMPLLAGAEPYMKLVRAVEGVVADPAAVLAFPYDWRLPVAHNASLLAEAMHRHLAAWRAHPAHDVARRRHPDGRLARVVLVAHSMGGLLARYLSLIPGATDDVRATVTLGTPFFGAVKAAVMLNSGRGAPLPARRPLVAALRRGADEGLRALTASLPGVHDLLPAYRCVDTGTDTVALAPSDVAGLGGDLDLARAARDLYVSLRTASLVGHRAVFGVAQPTLQSLSVRDGVVIGHRHVFEDTVDGRRAVDRHGDGTVYRDAAELGGAERTGLPQQHGQLARTDEAIAVVQTVVTGKDDEHLGPPLGAGEVGVDVPDLVAPETEFTVMLSGVDDPRAATCTFSSATTDRPVVRARPVLMDGELRASVRLPAPGLYRLTVHSGGASPVSQLVLAGDPELAGRG